MITPKEKAEELVKEFSKFAKQESYEKKNYNAIECALIAVDAIISYCCADDVLFLHKVKEEIEKL